MTFPAVNPKFKRGDSVLFEHPMRGMLAGVVIASWSVGFNVTKNVVAIRGDETGYQYDIGEHLCHHPDAQVVA